MVNLTQEEHEAILQGVSHIWKRHLAAEDKRKALEKVSEISEQFNFPCSIILLIQEWFTLIKGLESQQPGWGDAWIYVGELMGRDSLQEIMDASGDLGRKLANFLDP